MQQQKEALALGARACLNRARTRHRGRRLTAALALKSRMMPPTKKHVPSEWNWMPPPSIWIGILIMAIIFCTQIPGDERPLSILFGIVSLLTLAGWVLVAFVGRGMDLMDEADAFDVGGDSGGVVIFVPVGLTLLWISVGVVVAVSRLLLQQSIVTASLR